MSKQTPKPPRRRVDWSVVSWVGTLVLTVVVIAYDLIPALNGTPDDTISEQIRLRTPRHWWIPYGWCVLAGHFWGPLSAPVHPWAPLAVLASGLLVLALSLTGIVTIPARLWWALCLASFWIGAIGWAVVTGD